MKYKTALDWLYKWEKEKPNSVYLTQPVAGKWHNWTFKEVANEVRRMAGYINSLNLEKNSKIGILSKNCAHWIMADLAIFLSGNVSVPLYPNLNADTLSQILQHSETKLLFVGKLDDFSSQESAVPEKVDCISFPFYTENYPMWDDLISNVEPVENLSRSSDELASIIYTSGTTGASKGVMHSFFNFSFSTVNASKALDIAKNDEVFFSYLPLSHIAERLLVQMCSLYVGGKVFFAESLETFSENLSFASPTVFLGVPRIWTKFQQGILSKLPQKKLDLFLKIPIISSLIKKKSSFF